MKIISMIAALFLAYSAMGLKLTERTYFTIKMLIESNAGRYLTIEEDIAAMLAV